MKNVIKKIAAVAMAFAMIGTGNTIVKAVNPQANVGITAYAACNHNMPRKQYSSWTTEAQGTTGRWRFNWGTFRAESEWVIHEVRAYWYACNSCGTHLSETYYERRVRYEYR